MFFISEIELPEEQAAEKFVDFMRDEYIPAVETGATRIGKVEGLQLLQGTTPDTSHRFLWIVDWNGLEHDAAGDRVNEAVARKFGEFGATRKPHVAWREASWRSSRDLSSP